jgi:hypothetical protein
MKVLDPALKAQLHQRWDPLLGAQQVEAQLRVALAHKAAERYADTFTYANRWLRTEADNAARKRVSRPPEVHLEPQATPAWGVMRSEVYQGFWLKLGGWAVLVSRGFR